MKEKRRTAQIERLEGEVGEEISVFALGDGYPLSLQSIEYVLLS